MHPRARARTFLLPQLLEHGLINEVDKFKGMLALQVEEEVERTEKEDILKEMAASERRRGVAGTSHFGTPSKALLSKSQNSLLSRLENEAGEVMKNLAFEDEGISKVGGNWAAAGSPAGGIFVKGKKVAGVNVDAPLLPGSAEVKSSGSRGPAGEWPRSSSSSSSSSSSLILRILR